MTLSEVRSALHVFGTQKTIGKKQCLGHGMCLKFQYLEADFEDQIVNLQEIKRIGI